MDKTMVGGDRYKEEISLNTMIKDKERVSWNYQEFISLIEKLLAEDKTTGENHSEAYLHYTTMNLRRMNRIYKRMEIRTELVDALKNLQGSYTWLILVEAWCGDVGQNLGAIARFADLSPNIEMKMILRDENLDLMDQHLTYGGRGVPKLLAIDNESGKVVETWGPRPAPAQQMVLDYKALEEKPPYSEFVEVVQKWYAQDKTKVLQEEFLTLVNSLSKVVS
jgi:hypothetical protein